MTTTPPTPPDDRPDHDWRDPSQPRNPEDDVIVQGWRRKSDGTWEKVEEPTQEESEDADSPPL